MAEGFSNSNSEKPFSFDFDDGEWSGDDWFAEETEAWLAAGASPEPTEKPEVVKEPERPKFTDDFSEATIERERRSFAEKCQNYGEVLGDKNAEAEEDAFKIYLLLGANASQAVESLAKADSDTVAKMVSIVLRFSQMFEGSNIPDKMVARKRGDVKGILLEMIRTYDEGVFSDSAIGRILDRTKQYVESDSPVSGMSYVIRDGVEIAALSGDEEAFDVYVDTELELKETDNLKADIFRLYSNGHGIDKRRANAFKEKVCRMMDNDDPKVEALKVQSNSFSTTRLEYGISDLIVHAEVAEVSPRNVNELMHAYREIPTSDFARFEMNRTDALALQGVLWRGRDFVHDERPGIHELLVAMQEYYDSRDDEELHRKKTEELRAIVDSRRDPDNHYEYTGFDGERCFDLANYETRVVATKRGGTKLGSIDYDCLAIDILRRMVKNTEQVSLEKPHAGVATIDEAIDALKVFEMSDGTYRVALNDAANLATRVNEELIERQGEDGLGVEMLEVLSYTERMMTYALRDIKGKDYKELPFDPGFKEICKFSELTANGESFSQAGFDEFWNGMTREAAKDWPDSVGDGYGRLVRHVAGRLGGLAQHYERRGYPRHYIDSLWSGNLNHELIGLIDER